MSVIQKENANTTFFKKEATIWASVVND